MKVVILDAGTLGDDLDLSLFRRYGELTVYRASAPFEVKERLRTANVAILNKVKITEEILCATPNLRLICVTATGYDNIDLCAARAHGVAVTNVAGYSTDSVAQVTVAMALSAVTRLRAYEDFVKSGAYTASGTANRLVPVYHEIAGMTWGILGYGHIGRRVATVARAMGCHVIAHKRTPTDECETVSLDELCRRSDILSIHVPLSPATRGMLGEREFAMMKPDAVVINLARGAVLDEAAAARALLQGQIGFLCSDVYSEEPMREDSPFYPIRACENVIFTPHMAWGGYETRVRLLSEVAKNIDAFLAGEMRSRVEM